MTGNPPQGVFNLIDEPWLPVRRRSGAVEHIQPWQINEGIADDPFVSFTWPRPDFNGAAHELLIGLLATAAAPADDDEWEDWWLAPPTPEVLEQRFSAVAHAFDLDGPGPRFLQDLDPLDGVVGKEIATLLIDTPGAQTLRNNADLFVKRRAAPVLSRAAAAMALYTLNSYAPSGGAGHRTSLRGGGPLTTLVLADHPTFGGTLWGRIWPNVESREQIVGRAVGATPEDDAESIFPWLIPTRTSNRKAGGRSTTPADVHPLHVHWGMPRRIRILFRSAEGRECGLTAAKDAIVAAGYRTRNYGTDYTEGFEHPLTPHYRQRAGSVVKLPVHPNPGGISYRMWPGLVVRSKDGLREPASAIRYWVQERARATGDSRFTAFGYDMDNMKARSWLEAEMPLWRLDDDAREHIGDFVRKTVAAADTVVRLTIRAVKSASYDRIGDAKGDYGFIAERFYRDTEEGFYGGVNRAIVLINANPESDDPTFDARRRWAPVVERAALRLFDEYAPSDGLEDRDMHRHVKARFYLTLALRGHGKAGKSLFDGDLDIPSPGTRRARTGEREAA